MLPPSKAKKLQIQRKQEESLLKRRESLTPHCTWSKTRGYRFSVNKKIKRIALERSLQNIYKIFVIDELAVDEIKTAKIVALLKGLDVNSKALIVTADADEKVYKSARNIKGVTPTHVGTLNTYDVLNNDAFIVSKDAIAKIEEVLA